MHEKKKSLNVESSNMATIEPNRCYICKKLFCCIDCCSDHIKNKHCKSECSCPLCRGEPLIIRDFHHQPFLSHVIFNHLPLYCRMCGKLFRNHEDLKNLNVCKQCPLIHVEQPSYTTIETSTSELGLSSAPKTPLNLTILKKSLSWTGSHSNSFKNSPPTSTRHTSTPMHIGFLKQKFSTLMKSPNILLKTPKNFIKSPLIGNKQKKLIDKQNSNQNKEESIYFDFSITKSSSNCTPLKSILSLKSSNNETSPESFFHSITEEKQEVMQEAHKSSSIKNDNLSSQENNFSDSSYSTKKRLKSGKDNKDSGKKVRFSDQFVDNMSIISEYEDVNSNTINITGGEEFFETCQSFSDIPSMPIKSLPSSDSNVEHRINWKNCEEKESDTCKEVTGVKKLTKEHNSSSSSSKIVMMVLMEKTGGVNFKELSPLINSSLKKLESIVSQSSLDDAQAQQNKENNGLTIVSVNSYTRLSSVECYETSEAINMPQKSQQAVKHNNSSGGIFSAVANVVKNALKNLSGVAMTKNSLTNSINSPSTSLLQSPIQHSTPIVQNDSFSIQGSRACKRPREENVLLDKLDVENSNSLSIVRSPLQKRARRWYKSIRARQPIARMKDHSYPKGISYETQRFQQGAFTVKDTMLPLPTRAFQVDRSTQTDF